MLIRLGGFLIAIDLFLRRKEMKMGRKEREGLGESTSE